MLGYQRPLDLQATQKGLWIIDEGEIRAEIMGRKDSQGKEQKMPGEHL